MIQVEGLYFTYPKASQPAVQDISFEVRAGEIFGFLGPSGAGKSTTQQILTKLLRGYQGKVICLDKPLGKWSYEYYQHIGVSFELPNHYLKLSARENLQFFAAYYPGTTQPPQVVLEKVGLSDAADQRVGTFSKGMQMRLNFARALLHNPALYFLDEPTTGLDPGYARLIKDHILALRAAGKTIFLTTHQMSLAEELCDRVAFMVEGSLPVIESPAELKRAYSPRELEVSYVNEQVKRARFPLEGLGENAAFQAILQQYELRSIHSAEASLESIFLQITGTKLA